MANRDLEVFDREWANGVWEYVTGDEAREKAALARNADVVAVHREGWNKVAKAIESGLGRIAEAVERRR